MDVGYYKYHFSRLHTAKLKGKLAPHKAVLLIAVMRLVERGIIDSSEIELSDELVKTFKEVWAEKVPASCPFSCSIGQPFFHMQHEPFLRFFSPIGFFYENVLKCYNFLVVSKYTCVTRALRCYGCVSLHYSCSKGAPENFCFCFELLS